MNICSYNGVAFVAGTLGVFAMIAGAILLARESKFSSRILREEKNFITERIRQRIASLSGPTPGNRSEKQA